MKSRVVAVGLDSTDQDLLESLFSIGHLPRIEQLFRQSSRCRLETKVNYHSGVANYASTEGNWVMFQTGVRPETSGYWETVTYDSQTYRTTNDFYYDGYDYEKFKPFYALGKNYRVTTFDIPVSAVVPGVHGNQLVGWGGHFPYVVRGSSPANLMEQTNRRFGKNPVIYKDHGVFWSKKYAGWLEKSAKEAIQQRKNICLDFLKQPDLDLFVTVLGETHSVLHDLWADAHPTSPVHRARDGFQNSLKNFFQDVDQTVGAIDDALRPEDYLILFSVHGMKDNSTDLACLFFLSEMLYRLNFPGKFGIAPGRVSAPVPPVIDSGLHWYWFGEIWRRKASYFPGMQKWLQKLPAWDRWVRPGADLRFPFFINPKGAENGWMPSVWYRRTWPRSRSFALPAFADGHVRINVKGREKHGLVEPRDYHAECDRVTEYLKQWTDPRTNQPVVVDVFQTRDDALDPDPTLPHGDLIVVWTDQPFDVVDHPTAQRIGPVPYFRTGGHRPGGFAAIKGPGIPENTLLSDNAVYDLAPTILDLLDAPIPNHFEGQPIVQRAACSF